MEISQTELAERFGIGQTDISGIERGAPPWPQLDLIAALAQTLDRFVVELRRESG